MSVQAYERIDLRTSSEIKTLIMRAAATTGLSVSAFLLGAAQERAEKVLAETEVLRLNTSDWDAFFQALNNTDKPRPRLASAAIDYLAWREQQE